MLKTKRDAIQEAALVLFAEKGIDATTTREIAQRADTAEGNIYRHFKGKDDLVRQLFERGAAEFHDTLVRVVGQRTEPRERLRALVLGVFTFADESPQTFAYLLTAPHSDLVQSREGDWRPLPMRLFVETLEQGISAGLFREINPVLATGWIVAMTQRAILLKRTRLLSMSGEEVMETTAEAVLRLLQRNEPGLE